VNRTYVSKLEKGTSYPGLEIIAKLATGLEVEPAELIMRSGLISAPYWSSSTASLRRLPPTTAPATRPHSLSWAMLRSATFELSKASMTERTRSTARQCFLTLKATQGLIR